MATSQDTTQITFEILMYLNVYYFGLYWCMEMLFLFIKVGHEFLTSYC